MLRFPSDVLDMLLSLIIKPPEPPKANFEEDFQAAGIQNFWVWYLARNPKLETLGFMLQVFKARGHLEVHVVVTIHNRAFHHIYQ